MKSTLINNLEIAKSQEVLSGEVSIDQCERLADTIDDANRDQLEIHFGLAGGGAKYHLPSIHLTIDATLPLVCQRCLEKMQLDVSLAFDYIVSESEPEEFVENDDADWLETSREMNLNELIEDELLIALPLAPTHEERCKPMQLESGEKHNPFASLKDLIK